MSAVESKLQEYQLAVGRWTDRQRSFELQAQECAQQAELLKARIAGIQEAMALIQATDSDEAESVRIVVRKRHRSLTGHWQQIMQLVDDPEGFDYGSLAVAVEAVGHDANRDTLRSQMSLYKSGGFVEAIADGRFRLTNAGRRAAGIDVPDSGDDAPNEIGAANAAPEARPDANPA